MMSFFHINIVIIYRRVRLLRGFKINRLNKIWRQFNLFFQKINVSIFFHPFSNVLPIIAWFLRNKIKLCMDSSNFKIEHRILDTYVLNVETATQFSEFLYLLKTLLSKRNLRISYLQINKFLRVQHIIMNEWQFRFWTLFVCFNFFNE